LKEQEEAINQSFKWQKQLDAKDKKAKTGMKDDSDDEESDGEDPETTKDSPRKETDQGPSKPRSTWTTSDGIVYEDWSQLPESLVIGNTYKFVFVRRKCLLFFNYISNFLVFFSQRVLNKSPKEIRNMKISFRSKMAFRAFKAPEDHNTGLGDCVKKVLIDSNSVIRPGQQCVYGRFIWCDSFLML
jgi:hypothetical protein